MQGRAYVPLGRAALAARAWSAEAVKDRRTTVEEKLKAAFSPSELVVNDFSQGCEGGTLQVQIKASAFGGKTHLQRHRLVNDVLKEEIASYHAFTLDAHPE